MGVTRVPCHMSPGWHKWRPCERVRRLSQWEGRIGYPWPMRGRQFVKCEGVETQGWETERCRPGDLMRWEMWVRWLRWLEVMWGAVSCLGGGERRVLKWTGVADITIIWRCGIEYCVSAGHMRSLIIGFLNSKSLSKKLQLCSAGWWAGQQRHSQHSAASQSGEGRGAGRIWWWWHIDNTQIHWYTTPVSHRVISEYRGSCLQWGSSENVSVSGPWC